MRPGSGCQRLGGAPPTDSYLCVCVCGFQLKLSDGLPHSLLDPHARNLQQGQRVVHWLDGDVEGLGDLAAANTGRSQ